MNQSDNSVTLEIATPKGLFKGLFPTSTEVSIVIENVVKEMGLLSADKYELHFKEKELKPLTKKLSEFGLSGVVELTLVATGTGV